MQKPFFNGCKVVVTNNPPQADKHPGFTDEMKPWLFQIVTITGLFPGCERECCYTIKEDGGENAWNYEWLRPIETVMRLSDETAILHYNKNGKGGYRKHRVKIADLTERLSETRKTSLTTPILPAGAIHYAKKGERELVVCQFEPQIKSVVWTDLNRTNAQQRKSDLNRYALAFPYIIIICLIADGNIVYGDYNFPKIFYRVSPISSLNDDLFHTNLQNVSKETHWLCLHPEYEATKTGNIEHQVNALVSELWSGIFTDNMGGNDDFQLSRNINHSIDSVEKWQKISADDPLFVLGINWKKSDLTIKNIIRDRLRGNDYDHERETSRIEDANQIADLMYSLKETQE